MDKIALGQIEIVKNNLDYNFQQIKEQISIAKNSGYEVIVFPMLCLSGNTIDDSYFNYDCQSELLSYNDLINELSDDIHVLFSNIFLQDMEVFKGVYHSYNQEILCLHFDDLYSNSNSSLVYDGNTITVGFDRNYLVGDYNFIFANDYYIKDEDFKVECDNVVVYCNCVGTQNIDKHIYGFSGGSFISDNNIIIAQANNNFKSELVLNTINNDKANLFSALVNIIKSLDVQIFPFKPNYVIGLSGGLDSSVNLALLVAAVGSKRVLGYNMASKYNSDKTISTALKQANKLGVKVKSGSIEPLVQATISNVSEYEDQCISDFALENVQARIRGHLLSTFAAINNGIVINNGNKVESALGYCTLYGDLIGAYSPIGDLYKVDLFELSQQINEYFAEEIISSDLLPNNDYQFIIAPSAELKNAQVDPMKWFYHDLLIDYLLKTNFDLTYLLTIYENGTIYDLEMGKWIKHYHLDDGDKFIADLDWIVQTINKNIFKRIVSPPLIVLSNNSFGNNFNQSQKGFSYTAQQLSLISKIKKEEYNG
ncbi:MAG: NAD(+) synthase [Erysipelotrichaceae bacterium]